MAIDRTGISSLDAGAGDITYSGNEGPKSPQQVAGGEYNRVLELLEKVREDIPLSEEEKIELQGLIRTLTAKGIDVEQLMQRASGEMRMASADPVLQDEYDKYVVEMQELEREPVSIEQFKQQAVSGMAQGGRAGYQGGKLVRPPGMSQEEWEKIMFGPRGPRPLSSQSPYLSVHADGGRTGFQRGGGPDYMPTDPRPMGNPPVMEEIEDAREFRIANPNIEDVADYKGYYERLKKLQRLKELQEKIYGVQSEPLSGTMGPRPGSLEYWQMMVQKPQGRAYGGSANPTYTQKRKQSLAYGGIAGVDGRKRYGIGSWFQKAKDKVFDDLIPNEIKENPMLSAAVAGGLLNQFGIPFTGTPGDRMGQNWLGNLLGGKDLVLGPGGEGTISNNPAWGGIESLGKTVAGTVAGTEGINPKDKKGGLLQTIGEGIMGAGRSVLGGLQNIYGFGQDPYDAQGRPNINWQTPLAIGLSAGAAQAAMPKDVMPTDTSGIDIANVRSRALTGSDPNLHFLPKGEATTAYAQGGRTGYATGDSVEQNVFQAFSAYKNAGGKEPFGEWFSDIYLPEAARARQAAPAMGEMGEITRGLASLPTTAYEGAEGRGDFLMRGETLFPWETGTQFAAQGGRIGYGDGKSVTDDFRGLSWSDYVNDPGIDIKDIDIDMALARGLSSKDVYHQWFDRRKARIGNAQGGRIGAQEGGLMDLGGMEKDYRNEGGFVPIGGQERADDVPARLSKNEFVFTADAVRAAGGGDIDRGAEVMENVMENLEQGGQVSEESQGLEGARNMFATAQRLEGVM